MDKEVTLSELSSLLRDNHQFQEMFSYGELCRLSPEQKQEYQTRLDRLISLNSTQAPSGVKGKALEDLVAFLLTISGNLFSVVKNVRTATNEIDEIVELNTRGRFFAQNGILPYRLLSFLGECKDYKTSISVTYVGKFYSLLLTTGIKTGILFSYHGVSGSNWNHGSGLIKKIYLQRENEAERVAILNFALPDFQEIAAGGNFFDIVERKLKALQFDTSVDSFLSRHPAESQFP